MPTINMKTRIWNKNQCYISFVLYHSTFNIIISVLLWLPSLSYPLLTQGCCKSIGTYVWEYNYTDLAWDCPVPH
jgi:hypothetical protein